MLRRVEFTIVLMLDQNQTESWENFWAAQLVNFGENYGDIKVVEEMSLYENIYSTTCQIRILSQLQSLIDDGYTWNISDLFFTPIIN